MKNRQLSSLWWCGFRGAGLLTACGCILTVARVGLSFAAPAPAPVAMSDDDLLKLVKDRQNSLKCLSPQPQWVQSNLALLCTRPSPEMVAREKKNPHLNTFVRTFVTPAGEAAATGHESTHPAGTVLIKEKLPAVKGESRKPGTVPELFTGMLKHEKGFNPESADWEFFTASGDGTKITSRGKLQACIDCHKEFHDTDHVSRRFFEAAPVPQGADGTVLLHAKDAEVYGKMLRYEPKPEKNTLGYWTEKQDRAGWTFSLKKGGSFEVEVLQGCGKGSGGADVEIHIGSQAVKFTVEDTGHFQNFKARVVGKVTIEKGNYGLSVEALSKPGAAVMDLRSITLRPVQP